MDLLSPLLSLGITSLSRAYPGLMFMHPRHGPLLFGSCNITVLLHLECVRPTPVLPLTLSFVGRFLFKNRAGVPEVKRIGMARHILALLLLLVLGGAQASSIPPYLIFFSPYTASHTDALCLLAPRLLSVTVYLST